MCQPSQAVLDRSHITQLYSKEVKPETRANREHSLNGNTVTFKVADAGHVDPCVARIIISMDSGHCNVMWER